jgi:prolyl oligopeptidase
MIHPKHPDRPVYPESPAGDHVDVLHGVRVPDPYRWLEEIDSERTRNWIEAQNKVTSCYLDAIPARRTIRQRMKELWNYEQFGVPFQRGDRLFFTRNDGLQNQPVLYWMASRDDDPRVLLDPNELANDGTIALTGIAINNDGTLLAYGLSSAGSDWQEWHVREIESGRDLDDHLEWIKFTNAAWFGDGFFYCRYDEPTKGANYKEANYNQKLYYHALATPQSADRLIYERPDQKKWFFGVEVTQDDHTLVLSVHRENAVFIKDLQDEKAPFIELLPEFDAGYTFIGNDDSILYFMTDLNAPLGRVIAIDLTQPGRKNWREIIPEASDSLQGVRLVGERFFAAYLRDAYSHVLLFDLDGKRKGEIALPDLGSVTGFGGPLDRELAHGTREDREAFYGFSGFTMPGTIYRYNLETSESTLFREPRVEFDPAAYVTEQVFYKSRDGTRVPMFLTYKKGMVREGNHPTYLYGYGGFAIPLTPSFSVSNLVWMEIGGVYAQANLRGGGEYGKAWHETGSRLQKQNVFDDFIAAAEWLIDNKITTPAKLAIGGRSNGGLLVGVCMTQRPDLFGACLPGVGVMDMLRFHRFTIGWAWTSDYGSPDERRVFPAHSFKFAAALQAAQQGNAPVLIRIDTKAGHGMGKPVAKMIEEQVDCWTFLVENLAMPID